jgi:hypothetical protein
MGKAHPSICLGVLVAGFVLSDAALISLMVAIPFEAGVDRHRGAGLEAV